MSLINKFIGKAQRYAQQNPDKVRGIADKVAHAADKRTKGKYRSQIDNARRKVDGLTGGGHGRSQYGAPDPHRDDIQDPHRDDPRYR